MNDDNYQVMKDLTHKLRAGTYLCAFIRMFILPVCYKVAPVYKRYLHGQLLSRGYDTSRAADCDQKGDEKVKLRQIAYDHCQRKWRHLCSNAKSRVWLLLMDESCELTD